MITERSIVNALIWITGLIVAPYLAIASFSNNPYLPINPIPLAVLLSLCGIVAIFGYGKDRLCLIPLLGTYIGGRLTLVPLKLAPSDLCAMSLVLYYFIRYTALQRKKVLTGPYIFFIPILAIAGIVLYHEPNFGMRSMGSGREGGRGAVLMLLAAVAYVCGVSVDSPPPIFLRRFPLYCVLIAGIFSIPFYVTTYFPGTAPIFYLITDNINGSAYASSMNGDEGIVRETGQATVGSAVILYLMAYYPYGTWWRPERWWIVALVIFSLCMVTLGGFRSMLAGCSLGMLVAAWCHYSWRSLVLVPPAILAIAALVALQDSHAVHLPLSAQRTLSVLPGDWDPGAVDNAQSSNGFRLGIQRVYINEYMSRSPLLGNGISYDSTEFQRYTYLSQYHETEDGYYQSKLFITGKMFHTGWISVYDIVGVVGGGFFITLGIALIGKTGKMVFGKEVDRKSPVFPLKIWLFSTLVVQFVSFFTLFGDIKSAFPTFCYFAVLWVQLDRLERRGYRQVPQIKEVPFDREHSGLPVPV